MILQRRHGGERLERGSRLECAAHRSVEHGAQRIGRQHGVGLAHAAAPATSGQIVRIEIGLRIQREQAPRAHVDHHRCACGVRAEGALDRLHELDVDGESQVTPGDGLLLARLVQVAFGLGPGPVAPVRVDDAFLPPALAAQVTLPRVLDTRRARAVSAVVSQRVHLLALLERHALVAGGPDVTQHLGVQLGHVAEHVRAQVLVRVVANEDLLHFAARELHLVLLQLGHDVARHVLAHEHGTPARAAPPAARLIHGVVGAREADPRLDAGALIGVEPEHVGDLGPRIGIVGGGLAALQRSRAGHHAPGDDCDVVGGPAGREHPALRVAHHASGRGQRRAPHDVLVRRGLVVRPFHDLQLKEADHHRAEGDEDRQREPLVALPEFRSAFARDEQLAHARPPEVSLRAVAVWMRRASRNSNGATTAVATTCGSTSR